jgi:outer membrane protein assembly factor BamB
MEDGTPTRDPVYVGMVFKGAGALDPRGYPLLYLGAGLKEKDDYQRIYIVNLLDGTIAYRQSGVDAFAHRGWFAFDSSPLVDAETDTLIWPGESGVLYTMKLNTQYDKAAGTISVAPDTVVKCRYTNDYYRQGRYLGYEGSAVVVDHYLYAGDNAGMLHCIDLNTMELVWAQDILDDLNSTPVFDWGEDGRGYLYIAPSLDYSGNGRYNTLPICKLDAQTGEILWTYETPCYTEDGVSGGTLSSPLLGRPGTDLEDLVIYSVGRSPSAWTGTVVALNKHTGQVVWEMQTKNYMWSSPIGVYDENGKGYIFQGDASGNCYLLDGMTGEQMGYLYLGSTVESSPIVFGNRVVLGTRSYMYLFEIT